MAAEPTARDATLSLPKEFSFLSSFAAWSLPTETERTRKRNQSLQEEISDFYEAMCAQLDAIMEHLNAFPLTEMPDESRRLYYMVLSLAEVAPAIEFYRQPGVIDGFDPERFLPVEDFRLRPKL